MTVAELIELTLQAIRNQFYADRSAREYKRDEPALMRAISTYGVMFEQRAWRFDADWILHDLMKLLNAIKTQPQFDTIEYFPVYLTGAIKKSIGCRAEELNAEAKRLDNTIARAMKGVRTIPAIQKQTDVEVLAALNKHLRRSKKVWRLNPRAPKQPNLL